MRRAYRKQESLDPVAAAAAGLIAGIGFIVVHVVLRIVLAGDDTAAALRYTAATLIGRVSQPAAESLPLLPTVAAVLVHLVLGVLLALVLALVAHRWRLLGTLVAGTVLGLLLYLVAFYGLQTRLPWLLDYRSWTSLAAYVLYGVLAALLYELLERDRLVPQYREP